MHQSYARSCDAWVTARHKCGSFAALFVIELAQFASHTSRDQA
jgi:hypothetical protein